ncbi:MAG: hypothetical protein JW913_03250 [Chitinispirillaceae bacterium]|nr:hypothetical protein [Chitinispirillaceae bacterium]
MNTPSFFKSVIVLAVLLFPETGRTFTIESAEPTHYFYTPTAYLNTEFDMVGSLHEAAYTLPYKLQAHTSIVDNVGRLCFGMRYGILNNLSAGAGLAWSFSSFPYEGHGILHSDPHPRFGTFLCWGPVLEDQFEMSVTPHMQIGYHFSMGGDVGMMITPSNYWSIIGEFGFLFDFNDARPYINTVWGARVHPPQIPFLSFDGGLDFVEKPPEEFAQSEYAFKPFIDAIFTMKTMR